MTRYKKIIWDWNGTLFDDAWLCVEIMNDCLKKRGLPELSLERYRRVFRFPVRAYYRDLGFDFASESFETVGTEFIAAYEARRLECRLQPDAADLIERLHGHGVRQSVLSAYRQSTLHELLEHFALMPFLDEALGLQDHYAESKREIALRWIDEHGGEPSTFLMIGDSVHDYEVASAMGVHCLLVLGGHATREALAACGAPVLESLREVPDYLQA